MFVMFILDFIFLNLSLFNLTLFLLMFLALSSFILCSNNQSFIGWGFCLFFFLSFSLVSYGLELYGSIIFLSELVVFFYIFVINLIRPNQSNHSYYNTQLLMVLFLFLLGFPTYHSFYNYNLVLWYFSIYSMDIDVFAIFIYFYFYNFITLFFVGVLLTICTYVVCSSTIFINSSYNSSKYRGGNYSVFFEKKQSKSKQNSKKPYLFYNIFFNDK